MKPKTKISSSHSKRLEVLEAASGSVLQNKGVLKHLVNFAGKQAFRLANLLKRNSHKGVFR